MIEDEMILISIHALLAESDLYDTYAKVLRVNISIHALLAESDSQQPAGTTKTTYFYPRSPCGERLKLLAKRLGDALISIHALLAESDVKFKLDFVNQKKFLSTLSLRRATVVDALIFAGPMLFLSTLSLRRATGDKGGKHTNNSNFYPRSPCGERRKSNKLAGLKLVFLSTLSLRRATIIVA